MGITVAHPTWGRKKKKKELDIEINKKKKTWDSEL